MTRYGSGRLPDFLLMGAPKAGTSALHAALAAHPQLFLSRVKEPKYYLCGDSPPPAYQGPGDAHSNREWVWQRSRYRALFAEAGDGVLCGESTPFYLYHRDARRRIAADLPRVRLVAVLRDPERIDAGWAPFWHAARRYGRRWPTSAATSTPRSARLPTSSRTRRPLDPRVRPLGVPTDAPPGAGPRPRPARSRRHRALLTGSAQAQQAAGRAAHAADIRLVRS